MAQRREVAWTELVEFECFLCFYPPEAGRLIDSEESRITKMAALPPFFETGARRLLDEVTKDLVRVVDMTEDL